MPAAPWAPLDAAAFAAAAGDFAASRVKTAQAKEALSNSSTALVSIIAAEATAANVQISERSDFSAYYLKVLLASQALSAAYSALELSAFRRLTIPAAERQGKKISAAASTQLQRARSHLGFCACAEKPHRRTHYTRSLSPPPPPHPSAPSVYGKFKKLSQPAVSPSRDEVVFASQAGASFASSSHGDNSCDTTTSSEGTSSSSSSSGGDSLAPAAGAAAAAAADAAAEPPADLSCDELVRPVKREPLSPLSSAPRPTAAKRRAAARPSPTPPQPSADPPPSPPSPAAGAWKPPTPLYLLSPPEGLFAAGGEDIPRAARREAQLDGALDKQLRADADGPLLARMAAAGAPMGVAAEALSLTRAAITAAGPSAGKAYVAGLKQQIAQLARQLAESNALVTRLRKSNSEWRRAALGEGGAAEDGGGEGER
jgi:hypothetical protein